MLTRFLTELIAVVVTASSVGAGRFEDGVAAKKRGDYPTALKLWTALAAQGDATARFALGLMYAKGEGVPQDYVEAEKWVRLAAAQGLAQAQNNLGVAFEKGRGVPQDYAEAAKWYRRAAMQGLAKAQNNLGFLYAKGHGVPRDDAKAVRWYHLAAAQGLAEAQSNVGFMHGNGEGVLQDYVLAHMWFNLAAARGDESAVKARDIVTSAMTPEQLAEAQRLAREWKPTAGHRGNSNARRSAYRSLRFEREDRKPVLSGSAKADH